MKQDSDAIARKSRTLPDEFDLSRLEELRELVENLAISNNRLENQHEAERTDNALQRQLYEKSLGMLEERLVRVENSVIFRFNRAVGNFLKSRQRKLARTLQGSPLHKILTNVFSQRDKAYRVWVQCHEVAFPPFDRHREVSRGWHPQTRISLVMATHRPNLAWLEETINSIKGQSYEEWQLCVCDDASQDPALEKVLRDIELKDQRVRVKLLKTRVGTSRALNAALELVDGECCAFLKQGDVLHSYCLHYAAEAFTRADVEVVYTDEDQLDSAGRRTQPAFKPDWSPDLLTSCMYWGRFTVARRQSLERACKGETEWLRPRYEGAHEYDLALRLTDRPTQVYHIPYILYHSRPFANTEEAQAARDNSILALRDALDRRRIAGVVEEGFVPNTFCIRRTLNEPPLASIVVCSRNAKLFESFVRQLSKRTAYERVELILVEHQSDAPFNLDRIESIWKRPFVHLSFSGPFNFSMMCNRGAHAGNGSVLAFLNDDVAPLRRDWLHRMIGHAERSNVGVVGARLLYPSGALQHAGIALGMADVAGHPGRFLYGCDLFPWLDVTRDVSAVTAACFVIRKHVFEELGGFDLQFPINYNDVDLCLRARDKGYMIIYEAGAVLQHREAVTRSPRVHHHERCLFLQRWHRQLQHPDPYLPAAFDRRLEVIQLAR
jgi:GT2 family glycosyltransferase